MEILPSLLHPSVLVYLAIVVLVQRANAWFGRRREERVAEERRKAGLPDDVLVDHTVKLEELRRSAVLESTVLLASIVLTPFLIAALVPSARDGLALAFATILVWTLVSATDVAKSFLGGLAFKLFASWRVPFQVGDRVSLKGHSGKVTSIGSFYVWLQTADDDQVCVPTASLWSETLTTANAGARASLCVMDFYLASSAQGAQRQQAEDVIWDAIQASTYFDPAHPIQILTEQLPAAIQLRAKAYVTSTYNEPEFKSDVARQVLGSLGKAGIPLAGAVVRTDATLRQVAEGDVAPVSDES